MVMLTLPFCIMFFRCKGCYAAEHAMAWGELSGLSALQNYCPFLHSLPRTLSPVHFPKSSVSGSVTTTDP